MKNKLTLVGLVGVILAMLGVLASNGIDTSGVETALATIQEQITSMPVETYTPQVACEVPSMAEQIARENHTDESAPTGVPIPLGEYVLVTSRFIDIPLVNEWGYVAGAGWVQASTSFPVYDIVACDKVPTEWTYETPEPLPSPTPEVATFTPVPPECRVSPRGDYVNVREGPSVLYPVIDKIETGYSAKVIDASADNWLQVVTRAGNTGYVADWVVNYSPSCEEMTSY